jgi:hypothetical protein
MAISARLNTFERSRWHRVVVAAQTRRQGAGPETPLLLTFAAATASLAGFFDLSHVFDRPLR